MTPWILSIQIWLSNQFQVVQKLTTYTLNRLKWGQFGVNVGKRIETRVIGINMWKPRVKKVKGGKKEVKRETYFKRW